MGFIVSPQFVVIDHCLMHFNNIPKEIKEIPSTTMLNILDSNGFECDFNFRIDQSLIIDPRQVSVRDLIAQGPYSMVYEGEFESKPVAVKLIQPSRTSEVSFEHKLKFQREIDLQCKVDHENVVKLIGASVNPAMFLITELMEGGTLQKYLLNIRPTPLDLELVLSFALDISRAMEYLHGTGIIHRDIKPSNLLLTADKRRVKVADFGLAREEITNDMTCEAGTYRWMAPEVFSREAQIGVKKHYDHKVDVYSFSIVLWELLTNEAPFKGKDNMTVAYNTVANNVRPSLENLPKDLIPLLQSCWQENPTLRPEFFDITRYLESLLAKLVPIDIIPPTIPALNPRVKKVKSKKRKNSFTILLCFNDCLSE